MSRYDSVILMLGLALVMTGCKSDGNGDRVVITPSNHGETISVPKRGTLEVILQGNPTTGYEWEVARTDASLLPLDQVRYKSGSDRPGAGGKYRFEFNALEAGTVDLRLVYKRSWEAGAAETFHVTVHITDKR